jgi:hypothetical protein
MVHAYPARPVHAIGTLSVQQLRRERIAIGIASFARIEAGRVEIEDLLRVSEILDPPARSVGTVYRSGGIVIEPGEFAERDTSGEILLGVGCR